MKELNNLRFKFDLKIKGEKTFESFDVGEPFYEFENNILRIKEKLKINADIRTYIIPHKEYMLGEYNAAVIKNNDSILIGFTPKLVEILNENEIDFILGHEIGHGIFGHIIKKKNPFSIDSLYKEISADRIGYLICNNMNTITNCFNKLKLGEIAKYRKVKIKEILNNKSELSYTHPNASIRIDALLRFSMSKKYKNFFNETSYVYDNDTLEEQIHLNLINTFAGT